jgi:response regulator NasT
MTTPMPTNGLRVLLIDRNDERSDVVERALSEAGHKVVGHAESTLGLYDQVGRLQPDVIIIDTESPDRDTLEHICLLSERTPRPVVLFTDEDDRSVIREAVRSGVTAYIVDGLAAERKVVERAKGILMRKRGIGEDEAYHVLRKMAMEKNLRMREVAERVIGVAELLG